MQKVQKAGKKVFIIEYLLRMWLYNDSHRILIDMIEEYARHTGHADLIREAIDGRVGEDPPA